MSSEGTEMCKPGCEHCAWQLSDEGKEVMAELAARTRADLERLLSEIESRAKE